MSSGIRKRWSRRLGLLPFFIDFLKVSGVFAAWAKDRPLHYVSNNVPDKHAVLATFLLSILAGHHRLLCMQGDAHITGIREDTIHPEPPGVDKLVSEDGRVGPWYGSKSRGSPGSIAISARPPSRSSARRGSWISTPPSRASTGNEKARWWAQPSQAWTPLA